MITLEVVWATVLAGIVAIAVAGLFVVNFLGQVARETKDSSQRPITITNVRDLERRFNITDTPDGEDAVNNEGKDDQVDVVKIINLDKVRAKRIADEH